MLWVLLGLLTIGSIMVSGLGWIINLVMGSVFCLFGTLFWMRVRFLHRSQAFLRADLDEDQSLAWFVYIDLLFVLGMLLMGGLLFVVGIGRVFGEGFAIFG